MALSWRNLPCALKAAIPYGKRTLGDPGQSDPPRGPQQGLLRAKHAGQDRRRIASRYLDERLAQPRVSRRRRTARTAGLLIGLDEAKAAFRRRWPLLAGPGPGRGPS